MVTTSERLTYAWQAYQSGNASEAAMVFQQVLQEDGANPTVWCLLGIVYRGLGKLDDAAWAYHQALRLRPVFPEVQHNLAAVLQSQGKLEEAIACYRQVLRALPGSAQTHYNLGVALASQGQLEEAATCYRDALRCRPDYADAHAHLGEALAGLGELDEARAAYQQALQRMPDSAWTHNRLGVVHAKQGRLEEALAHYARALQLQPRFADPLLNRGHALAAQGRFSDAEGCYRQALALQPSSPEGLANLADVLAPQGRAQEAEACYRQAADQHCHRSHALFNQGRADQALAGYDRALQLQPHHAEAHNSRGTALAALGRWDEAVASYHQALRCRPDFANAHKNLSLALLQQGRFAEGWREYEWRWQCLQASQQAPPLPLWDGAPLEGRTILLRSEQGLGDTLQFIRYAPLVKERGGRVVVSCPRALLPLLASCPGIDTLVSRDDPLPAFDVFAPLLSLPRLLGTTLQTIPAVAPYLAADRELIERWRKVVGEDEAFKVGIVWQGNPRHEGDRYRSVRLAQFAPLAEVRGARLFSLQVGDGGQQLAGVAGSFQVTDLGSRFDPSSLADAAAVVRGLDLVVTVDTAMAHLAGALAAPVWLVLPLDPDWRWFLDREDSPWYPTMRLFRQTEFGQWQSVFRRLAEALEQQVTR